MSWFEPVTPVAPTVATHPLKSERARQWPTEGDLASAVREYEQQNAATQVFPRSAPPLTFPSPASWDELAAVTGQALQLPYGDAVRRLVDWAENA
ncbi:hypothetical protein [Amycolatopsis sp. cmx-4-61]|uniref:hypothetical protein n=1 Tax=Amycolatopsis sp. cmx-4-61 TaxID=2790937 RepID=UPI0039792F8F